MSDNLSVNNTQQEKRELLAKLLKERAAQKQQARLDNSTLLSTVSTAQKPIDRVDRNQSYFPLSFAQQRMWLLNQLEPGNPAYNISLAIRLKGSLSVEALNKSLTEIVRRHETLRTTFTTVDERPVQVIHEPFPITVPVVNLECPSESETEKELRELISKQGSLAFDLVTGPLLRTKLVRLEETYHVFILSIHHIISDAWSGLVLIRELQTLYRSFSHEEPSPLADLSVQYIDFAHWQQEWLQGDLLDAQLDYWKKQLAAPLPVLDLPTDFPRPKIQTFHSRQEVLALSESLTTALKDLSRKEGCTMFMTLLAAFSILLYRQTGQPDLVIGSPIAGRSRKEVESLIGFFINTLVMRVNLDNNPSFRELIQRVREVALQAYANQDVPFEKLLEELHPERNISRTPIYQVFFNMLNFNNSAIDFGDLDGEFIYLSETEARFDITLYAREQNKQIHLLLVYNSDLFLPERMVELMQQFHQLLEAVAAAPDKSIQEFPLLTPSSAQMLPDPGQPLEANWYGSVHARFAQQAIAYPDRSALIDTLGCWSYKDLETSTNQLAHYLLENGIQRQDVVAVYARRNASLVWALLGILKAGAAFLILDPAYPAERLAKYISLAKPRGFINLEAEPDLPEAIQTALQASETSPALRIHWDGNLFAVLREYSGQNPGLATDPEDIAYIAFTSGSTGQPKGIVGTHRPLSHFFHWHTQTFGFHELDRFTMLSGLAHDPLLRDIFTPLWMGATLLIPDPEKMLAPGYLLSWLKQEAASVIHLTPSIEQLILDTASDAGEIKLEGLRYGFFGGESLTRQHINALYRIAPSVKCVNFYGATETPQAMAYANLNISPARDQAESSWEKETIPLGKGIDGVQILVLTNTDQLAGIGEVGEIHIRTPYLSQGYLNDASLTEQRFRTNPFTQNTADRMYKTGDRGCYLPTGEVKFLGRNDDQVKIRGFRIELGEIESTLMKHPTVKQAIVVAWQGRAAEKHLVAYIVPNEVQFPSAHEMKGYLQQHLPSYMIPAHYILIDAVPLTPNGKVDRRALPEPDLQAIRETVYLAPQTQLQEVLAEIWADVLHLEKVSIHDNFFELGGHSLLATQIMSRIRRTVHVELPLRVLFEFPTIASMASQIESLQKNVLDIPPLKPRANEKPPRLSFAQERMWFIHQLAPESAAYNMSGGLHIEGELNTSFAEQAFNIIIERHEILRTTFDVVDGVPTQTIASAKPIQIPVTDLQSLGTEERNQQAQQLIRAIAKEPFDLVNGPLLRVLLIKLGEKDHILSVCMHHIISDQWSGGVIMREFAAIYNALCTNEPISLHELPVQYADYSLWQRDWLTGALLESKLSYWKKQLDGISVLDLPIDYPRPAMQTFNGDIERFPLSASTIDAVRNLCRQEQITPFMFFLGIFQILLLRYSGQQDVAVGSPIANRNWFETESLIGTFVNTVVLRAQINDNPTFREFLHYIRDISLDAFNHQDFPFEKLIEELQPERDMSHSPLIQVLFNVQNAPVEMPQLYHDPQITPLWPETRDAQFDITLSVTTDIVPSMRLSYNTDLFKRETILRMLGHMETLIQGALADPGQKILDLQILPQTEREKQLVAWNDTLLDYPESLCVHELMEARAERTPDAVAVQFQDKRLTYRELNSRANQLAHHLRELGVTAETPVGISMERSMEMTVGLLGILKAGGTYIPLDPFFPRDRLAYMVEYSETNILLTHEQPRAKETADLLKKDGLVMVNLDRDWQTIAECPTENLPASAQSQNLAYILFTSGSTGKPKGVQIPHRAVVNFLASMQQRPGLTANDRLLAVTTLSFDISVLEIFLPLITGACVVVLPGEVVFDGAALIQYLAQSNISVIQATPATWQMLIDAGWQGDKNLKVLCGGEAMPKDLARWLTQHVGSVWNMYGPTETTVWSTLSAISADTEVITIGHPIANTQIYILDKNFEPLPVGVAGELFIAGDGVARGYLKQPELTAEKFIPDPFVDKPGALMYRTGDQARYLSDGRIDFLGRADFQVKIRGFRIELGEIESILNSHAEIRQAVVIAREDTPGDKRLVAYLITENGQQIDTGELRQFIRAKLPEYMVPAAFVFLEEFPMTPNRKVNRKALPAPDQINATTDRDVVFARTHVEAKLINIWEELLRVHPIGIKDNFFELGGHSLLAVHVFSRIKQDLGVNLPLATLFHEPTIEHLAQVIQQESGPGTWSSLIEIEPEGEQPPFFCVHGLTGDILWFRDLAQCLAPHYPFYGLQSRGLDGIQPPIERIEDMAAHYIEEIRLLQPAGPYCLGGASFGGTVALEMAQQLLAQGEEVSLLAIFDDSPTNVAVDSELSGFQKRINVLFRVAKNFPNWLKEFIKMGPSRMLGRIRRKLRLAQKLKDNVQADTNHQFDAEDLIDFASELSAHRQQLITCNYQAMKQYVPQPYTGRVTLFRAKNRPLLNIFDPEAGWQKLAPGRVTVYDIPSSHEGMFKKPQVSYLADKLRTCLETIPSVSKNNSR